MSQLENNLAAIAITQLGQIILYTAIYRYLLDGDKREPNRGKCIFAWEALAFILYGSLLMATQNADCFTVGMATSNAIMAVIRPWRKNGKGLESMTDKIRDKDHK